MARKVIDPATSKQLFSTRYKQGGRTVYQLALTPAQLASIVAKPTEESSAFGNRRIQPKHASDFARYFQNQADWVAPGIILRAPNIFSFEQHPDAIDVQFGMLFYPERRQSEIHIVDGQHRIRGFHEAIEEVEEAIDKARSALSSARRAGEGVEEVQERLAGLEGVRNRLHSERVSVEIQVVDDIVQWRQMFFDIADNAFGISSSVKAQFDQRKAVNRALVQVLDHPVLDGLVDKERARLVVTSDYFLTANHVVETLRVLTVGFNGRFGKRFEAEILGKEMDIVMRGDRFFSSLVAAFPLIAQIQNREISPAAVRRMNLIGSPLFLRILAAASYELMTNRGWSSDMVQDYFATLAPHLEIPLHENSALVKLGADPFFNPELLAPLGRRQDSEALMKKLVDWAILQPKELNEAPAPAPAAPEADQDDEIDFALGHDTTALEVEERNATEEIAKESKARARARSTVGAK